ncbi:MAG: hypothetical protein JNM63_06245, partial [Spirochaetia bacterium]|nr:hypothetical protein [Spirochaetia bacterium]
MKSISKIFLSAGMSLCLISCVTLTQIPGRTSAPEAHTLPPGSEVLLATCQLSHPAAVWTEERTGYTVQRTVPFENAENFFQAALSNLPKIALGKISYRSTGSDRIAAFRSATNQDRIQNHFRPIAHHLPAFSLAGRTNAGQIAPVCMTPLGAHPQIGGATNVFFLALHGQIR